MNKMNILLFATLIFVTAAETRADSILSEADCGEIKNSSECAKKMESLALKANDQALRDGPKLVLKTKKGDVEFRDAHGSFGHHLIRCFSKEAACLVRKEVSEESSYVLVDLKTSKKVELENQPVFSPSGERLATAARDFVADNPNGIQVWEKKDGIWKAVFTEKADGWGPGKPRWLGDSEIRFEKFIFSLESPSLEKSTGKDVVVSRSKSGKWKRSP